MPTLDVNIEHSLIQSVALERIKSLLSKLKNEYGNMISDLNESWSGTGGNFSFKAMGMLVEGIITVDSKSVHLDGKIPFAALPFKSKIEKTIIDEAGKLLK
jgi:hypothetical protein